MRKSALLFFGLVVAALVALGLVVLSSASEANGVRLYNDPLYFMKRQFMYLAAGVAIAAGAAAVDYRKWREHWVLAALFYVAVIGLLCAVFGFRAINGSHRWIAVGPVRLQPSELAKIATVLVIAVWMDKAGWRVELFRRGALWPAVIIGAIALPVLLEPDFGSVMVIGLAGFLVMFVSGTRILHMLPFFACGGIVLAYKVLTNENRVRRLVAFAGERAASATTSLAEMDPAAYQAYMARVALQNGGIGGVGLGESMQKHFYLPEAHTDFIFAVGAEELGILFSIAVIALFVAFFTLSVYIARKAPDRFGRYLVVGMSFIVFFQAAFNLGVVCEALPTKGMALPFFSYGGTNLLSAFFAVGTILSVGIHSFKDRKRQLGVKQVAG